MALITWNETFSVGIERFDRDHRKLIEIINSLHDAMKDGKGKDILGKILDELIAYTRTHFETEEQMMKQHGYPDYEFHKKAHDRLVMDVAKIVKNYHGGTAPLPSHVMQFLVDWLTMHINGLDKKYGPCLKEKGIT